MNGSNWGASTSFRSFFSTGCSIARIACALVFALAAATANAQECKGPPNIPTEDQVAAQTATCLLSVDGRLLVDERCNVSFSPDGREVVLDTGKYYLRVLLTLDRKGLPTILTASWNHGTGRSDQLVSLGHVTSFQRERASCWRNRRIEACLSDYMTCKCQNRNGIHCQQE